MNSLAFKVVSCEEIIPGFIAYLVRILLYVCGDMLRTHHSENPHLLHQLLLVSRIFVCPRGDSKKWSQFLKYKVVAM